MRKEVKELAHKEYLRVHSLINWGPLTHEELACLHDQYSTEPPKRVTLQTTEKQGKKVAPYMHIPKVKTKSPSYHNISHLVSFAKNSNFSVICSQFFYFNSFKIFRFVRKLFLFSVGFCQQFLSHVITETDDNCVA